MGRAWRGSWSRHWNSSRSPTRNGWAADRRLRQCRVVALPVVFPIDGIGSFFHQGRNGIDVGATDLLPEFVHQMVERLACLSVHVGKDSRDLTHRYRKLHLGDIHLRGGTDLR